MKPLVSVIVPVYNAERYVGRAIDSILHQTYEKIEIIVVDDGSTDETETVLAKYGPLIRRLKKENGGPAAARNLGIKEARGNFVAFLDSDDLFLPEKIEEQMEILLASEATALATCNGYCIDETGAAAGQFTQKRYRDRKNLVDDLILKRGVCTSFSTLLARKKALFDVGLIDEKLLVGEDRKMWLAFAEKYEIGFLDKFLIKYRKRKDSISAVRNNDVVFENNRLFLSEIFARKQFERRLVLKAKSYSYHYFYAAWAYNLLKNRRKAKTCILKSLLCYPFRLTSESRAGLLVKIFFGDRFFNFLNA